MDSAETHASGWARPGPRPSATHCAGSLPNHCRCCHACETRRRGPASGPAARRLPCPVTGRGLMTPSPTGGESESDASRLKSRRGAATVPVSRPLPVPGSRIRRMTWRAATVPVSDFRVRATGDPGPCQRLPSSQASSLAGPGDPGRGRSCARTGPCPGPGLGWGKLKWPAHLETRLLG